MIKNDESAANDAATADQIAAALFGIVVLSVKFETSNAPRNLRAALARALPRLQGA
jgi:hypothetical protein